MEDKEYWKDFPGNVTHDEVFALKGTQPLNK